MINLNLIIKHNQQSLKLFPQDFKNYHSKEIKLSSLIRDSAMVSHFKFLHSFFNPVYSSNYLNHTILHYHTDSTQHFLFQKKLQVIYRNYVLPLSLFKKITFSFYQLPQLNDFFFTIQFPFLNSFNQQQKMSVQLILYFPEIILRY